MQYDDNNELPNYEQYQNFIKYFHSLKEKNQIVSAFSVNENFSKIIKSASTNVSIEYTTPLNDNLFENSHGILFETKSNLNISNDIFYIGSTFEKI